MANIEYTERPDPPTIKPPTTPIKRSSFWAEVAETLNQHPNQWALVARNGTNNRRMAQLINAGHHPQVPADLYEADYRPTATPNRPDVKRYDIYVRRRPVTPDHTETP